jgi:hypothetical protein
LYIHIYIPKERKVEFLKKLKNVGVNVKKFLKKTAVVAATVATVANLAMPFKNDIKSFIRHEYPNVAELYKTRNLNTNDFSNAQLKAIGSIINKAIASHRELKDKKGKVIGHNSKKYGGATYEDYPSNVNKFINQRKGNLVNYLGYVENQILADPNLMVGTTVGRFLYQRMKDGSYKIHDFWDFKKAESINTTKEDIKDLPYPMAIAKIMASNKVGIYPAIRHIAYLEHPDTAPNSTKTTIDLVIPAEYVTSDTDGGSQ